MEESVAKTMQPGGPSALCLWGPFWFWLETSHPRPLFATLPHVRRFQGADLTGSLGANPGSVWPARERCQGQGLSRRSVDFVRLCQAAWDRFPPPFSNTGAKTMAAISSDDVCCSPAVLSEVLWAGETGPTSLTVYDCLRGRSRSTSYVSGLRTG